MNEYEGQTHGHTSKSEGAKAKDRREAHKGNTLENFLSVSTAPNELRTFKII